MVKAAATVAFAFGLLALPMQDDEPTLDLALVLAVDGSGSMTADECALQRDGFAEAFRSPQVHRAIRHGALQRIAVTYVEWADAGQQRVRVPWTVIAGPEDARRFADRIAACRPTRASTPPSRALSRSAPISWPRLRGARSGV